MFLTRFFTGYLLYESGYSTFSGKVILNFFLPKVLSLLFIFPYSTTVPKRNFGRSLKDNPFST
jgi:hypothetical protein